MSLINKPIIESCNWVDISSTEDLELINISSEYISSFPVYVKLIIDNVTTSSNSISQKIVNLKSNDYNLINNKYEIQVSLPVNTNEKYTLLVQVFYSNGVNTPFSDLSEFITGPSTPVIVSATADDRDTILVTILSQSEVSSYIAILGYKDYANSNKLQIVENLTATVSSVNSTQSIIDLTPANLEMNIDYTINLVAVNSSGQSQVSNSKVASTTPVPDDVTNLTASFDLYGKITIAWTPGANSIYLPITKYKYTTVSQGEGYFLAADTVPATGNKKAYTFPLPFQLDQTETFTLTPYFTKNNVTFFPSANATSVDLQIPQHGFPTSLVATIDPSNLQIALTWDTYTSTRYTLKETHYAVFYNGQTVQSNSYLHCFYFFPNTVLGGTYTFEVAAQLIDYDLDYFFTSSNRTSITVNIPSSPDAPTNATASYTNASDILLNWQPPANNNLIQATSYNIYDMDNNSTNTAIATTTNLTYTFTDKNPGGEYNYSVAAVHVDNKPEHTVEGPASAVSVLIPIPAAPANIQGTLNSNATIFLTWEYPQTDVEIDFFKVYNWALDTFSDPISVSNSTPGTPYSYFVNNLTFNLTNEFQVYSYKNNVVSAPSNNVSIFVPFPSSVTTTSSSYSNDGRITLNWDYPVSTIIEIDTFQIRDSSDQVLATVATDNGTIASFILLLSDTYNFGSTYSFYIYSFFQGENSGLPAVIDVTLPSPSAPTNLTVTNNATTPPYVTLQWGAPANSGAVSADQYNIYQDGVALGTVVSPYYNTGVLTAGQSYTFVIKPVHQNTEFDSPATISYVPYQPSSIPTTITSTGKKSSIIFNWQNPVNTGGREPQYFGISVFNTTTQTYVNGSQYNANYYTGGVPYQNEYHVPYTSSGTYSETFSNLAEKTLYRITISLTCTGIIGNSTYIDVSTSDVPLINSISIVNGNLNALIDTNGSALLDQFAIITYNASTNYPTKNTYSTPVADGNGIVQLQQLLQPINSTQAILIIANAVAITTEVING